MMRDGKPAFYALMYSALKAAALEGGWALAIHGSVVKDLDLVAIAWTNDSIKIDELLDDFAKIIGQSNEKKAKFTGPHYMPAGRIVYTLSIAADIYIDLSVVDNREAD